MARSASLLVFVALGACTAPDSPDGDICELAAEHMESCLPGLSAARPATCEAQDEERSKWLLTRSCTEILTDAGDGKADGVPALQGVRIRKEGNRTLFSIPLAQSVGNDRKRLLDETIAKFTTRMGELNQKLVERGLDLGTLLVGPAATEFADNYTKTLDALLGSEIDKSVEIELGKSYGTPTKLSIWSRYVVPQAFIAYISTKFSVNVGVSTGVSATVMLVFQPWLTLAVDHTLAQPIVVDKQYDLDVGVLGVPNVDIGLGVGASLPLRIGVGAVFGPLDRPGDLGGWGVGLSGSATVPVLGGLAGKFVTVLKAPPLFMLMLGYSTGTGAELEIHGNFQKILDLDAFLAWVDSLAR
jgi:hypothetical protein